MGKTLEVELPFEYRDYQLDFLQEFEHGDKRRFMLIWARRSGKDVLALNAIIRQLIKRPQIAYYVFPSYKQGKGSFFESMTNDGRRFIDFIPKQLIRSINSVDLSIKLINNSQIRVVGSTSFDSLRGANPSICIFSEWAWCHPKSYEVLSPILLANGGKAVFLSTPNGMGNHMFEQYQIVKNNSDWYTQLLTVDDTKHISKEEIEKERITLRKDHDWVKQEFYCSFLHGAAGTYFGTQMTSLKLTDQIGDIPWRPDYPVYTSWDLGYDDYCCVLFFQLINNNVYIIDSIIDKHRGLDSYAKEVLSKPYRYHTHIGPHDIAVHEFSNGTSRKEIASTMGIEFVVCPNIPRQEGIEAVKFTIPRMFIDQHKCKDVVAGLEGYRRKYDELADRYLQDPVKDWTTDVADAARYMCVYLPYLSDTMTEQDAQDLYNSALYGRQPRAINSPYERPIPGIYGNMPYK